MDFCQPFVRNGTNGKKAEKRFSDVIEWWEGYVKGQIKWFCVRFTADMYRGEYSMINFYQQCLSELAKKTVFNSQEFVKFKEIKAKITNLQWRRLQGVYVRSKCNVQIRDEKTNMFHAIKRDKRRRSNIVSSIEDTDGFTLSTQEEISRYVFETFKQEFAKPSESQQGSQRSAILDSVTQVISEEENAMLIAPFTLDEITQALKMSANDKSPGVDGISAEFYKTTWSIIGADVTRMLNAIVCKAKLCVSQSTGIIVIIPKVTKPKKLSD